MSDKKKLMFARFPYGNQECPDLTDWLVRAVAAAKAHPRIEKVLSIRPDDTPITMTRNLACRAAREQGCDYLLMVDSDMKPDMTCTNGKDFVTSSLDFLLDSEEQPTVVAAPYCGPPPDSPVFVFRWTSGINLKQQANPSFHLEMYPREESAMWQGIVEVAAAATGLILLDLRVLDSLDQPYFDYEYTDASESQKASTEDVFFTRNLSLAGVPVYVNWDCWAGHWKRFLVPKPQPIYVDQIRQELRQRLQHEYRSGQKLEEVYLEDGKVLHGAEAVKKIRLEARGIGRRVEAAVCENGRKHDGGPVPVGP